MQSIKSTLIHLFIFGFYYIQHLYRSLNGRFRLVGIQPAGTEHLVFKAPGNNRLHKGIGTSAGRDGHRIVRQHRELAKEINRAIIETYEYLQTIPTQKERQKHLKAVEKGLKEQYTPRMKKLSFAQGKLLIKLVDRQTHSTSYELVKAFMGPFKAGFYQTFAALFGASLKNNTTLREMMRLQKE